MRTGPLIADNCSVDLGLKDRRALVTAASKGLGRACAEALVAEGAGVFISSRAAATIEATGHAIKAAGWAAADVSKEPQALVDQARRKLGGLDITLVTPDGPPPGTFESTPLESWGSAFELTLMSAVRLVKAALPDLKRSDQGRIVFITSVSVRQPIPHLALSNSLPPPAPRLPNPLPRDPAPPRLTAPS